MMTNPTTPNTKQELLEKIERMIVHRKGCLQLDDYLEPLPKCTCDIPENIEKLLTDTAKAKVNKTLDKVRNQSITVLPETYPTGQRTSIDAVPVSAIEQVRREINDE